MEIKSQWIRDIIAKIIEKEISKKFGNVDLVINNITFGDVEGETKRLYFHIDVNGLIEKSAILKLLKL